MAGCIICGKNIPDAKRSSRKYCSNKCRLSAHRSRKRVERAAKEHTITIWEHMDLMEVKRVSIPAYNKMQKMYAEYGRAYAEKALDIAIDLMMDAKLLSKEYLDRNEVVYDVD